MALLEEIEPPSHKTSEKTKNLKSFTKTKHQFNIYIKQFRAQSLSSLSYRFGRLTEVLIGSFKMIRNFILSNKYFPHIAMIALGSFVLISNISDRIFDHVLASSLVTTNPDTEYLISGNVDQFTPLISDDSGMVQKAIAASSYLSDGFISGTSAVTTEITSREEPLPDNSSSTVKYVVRPGDTLTGLGWKFDVKLSTLKYVNDLSNVDTIKPGATLKIPPRGYEVSAAQIAKKEADNKAKLATASRSTITRGQSSNSRSTQTSKTYYGTINGVRYVQRSIGECYTYVTSLGYPVGGHLLAKWIPTNSNSPKVGGLVVTYESWAGHVAIVTGVNGDGTFNIRERNYTPGWITERTLNVNEGKIKGFVN